MRLRQCWPWGCLVPRWLAAIACLAFTSPGRGSPTEARGPGAPGSPHLLVGPARVARAPLQQEGRRQSADRAPVESPSAGPGARGQPVAWAPAGSAPRGRGPQGPQASARVPQAPVSLEPARREQEGCPAKPTRPSAPVAAAYRPARATDFGGRRSRAGSGRAAPERSDRPRAPAGRIPFARRWDLPALTHPRSRPASKIRRRAFTKSPRLVSTERALAPRGPLPVAPTPVLPGLPSARARASRPAPSPTTLVHSGALR
jgi:hypothetical protein